jgi:nucleoside-diphosphate-sugar epimerase
VARILIVGCGCRGQALARALVADGHAVRGTTRDASNGARIAAAGAEPYVGDPDRIGTLMDALAGVTILCWLMGSASGENAAALHDGRLRMLFEKLVDTPVRGVVYEAAGSVGEIALARGRDVARDAHERWMIPLEVLTVSPDEHDAWLAQALSAVTTLLA